MHTIDPVAIEIASTNTTEMIPAMIAAYGIAAVIIILLVPIILGIVARRVGRNRGFKGGFAWGFFFGPLGVAIVALRPREKHLLRKHHRTDDK